MREMTAKKNLDIALAMERNTAFIEENKSKLSSGDLRGWLEFYILTIMWGLKGLVHGGHLGEPSVRQRLAKALSTFQDTAAAHGYQGEVLMRRVGGRAERILMLMFNRSPKLLSLLTRLSNRSSLVKSAFKAVVQRI